MISRSDLRKLARARLRDAEELFAAKRYDGAVYLCGYVIEFALKARICRTLHWPGFPSTSKEFRDFASFKTHDLNVLLHLSGIESKIKTGPQLMWTWSEVSHWDPAVRYNPVGSASSQQVSAMIQAAYALLKVIK